MEKISFSIGGAAEGSLVKLGGPEPKIIDLDKAADPFAALAGAIGSAEILVKNQSAFSGHSLGGKDDQPKE